MKYTFETDDLDEASLIINAGRMRTALGDIYEAARLQLKHGDPSNVDKVLVDIKQIAAENTKFFQ